MAIQFLNDQYISGTLQVAGAVTFDTAVNPGSDTDKIAVFNGSVLGFRTTAQILSDLGGVTAVTGTQPIISSGGTTPAISLNYTGANNVVESATDLEGTAIALLDSIIYNDVTDGNVKKGLISDLPYSATTGTVTSITPGADSGTGTAITTSGTITVAGGSNITTSVSGTTITVNTDFNQYGWSATDGSTTNSIPSGTTVTWQGGTGINVSLNGYILDISVDGTAPTGSGSTNSVTKWTSSTALGDGPITFATNDSTFAGNVEVNGTTIDLDSAASASYIADRANDTSGATYEYKTAGALKWYTGLRGLSNDNFYIFNNGTSVNTLILDLGTDAATFAGTVKATDSLKVNTVSATGDPFVGFYQNDTEKAYIQYVDTGDNLLVQTDGQFQIKTNSSVIALTLYTDQDAEFANKVGIGMTPAELLDIVSASGDARIRLDAPAASDTEIKFYNAGVAQYTIGHDDATDNFVIGGANVDAALVSIDKTGDATFAGNVTLGSSTKASDEWMYIDSDGSNSAGIQLLRAGLSKWFIYNPGGGNNFKIYDNSGGGYMEMAVGGNATFSADILTNTDSSSDIGKTATRWANIWVDLINGGIPTTGGPYLPLTGGTLTGDSALSTAGTATFTIESSGANGNNVYLALASSDTEWRWTTNRGDQISGNQGDLFLREDTAGVNALIFETNTGNATFAGTITATTNGSTFGNISVDKINLGDNEKVIWGGGSDLQIYHQSSDNTSYIFANNTNPLKIATETSATPITIGHTTSEVTIGDNLTVNGTSTLKGDATVYNGLYPDADLGAELGTGSLQFSTINVQTSKLSDNVYMGGGQLYIGTNLSSNIAATENSYRMQVGGGIFTLAKYVGASGSGTWTGQLTVANDGTVQVANKATSTATTSGDGSTTLTTKGYIDGLITGATIYQGTWDPDVSLNSGYGNPNLNSVTKTNGYYYVCSADGIAEPNGTGTEPDSWHTGDWVIYNDHTGSGLWQKIDNTSVLSGVGTGQTVAMWDGASSVTDSETLTNAPLTFSTNDATFAGTLYAPGIQSTSYVEAATLLYGGNGVEGAPSHTFSSDANTGMYRKSADTIGFATGGSLALTIANNDAIFTGSVAVAGSNAPEKKLSINSAQSNGIQFNYDNSNNYRNQILNYWNSSADSRMDFNIARTSGETPVTIMSVGYNSNVGIGTSTPNVRAEIAASVNGNPLTSGTTQTYGALRVRGSATNVLDIGQQSASPYGMWMQVCDSTSLGTEYPLILNPNGGNVGIGTDNPGFGKVQIKTASAIGYTPTSFMSGTNLRLTTGGTAAASITTGISMGIGGAAEAYIGAVQNVSTYADIVFQTYHGAYGERMRITSVGKVGIATTAPQNTLHVVGNTRLAQSTTTEQALNAGTMLEVRGDAIGSGVVDVDYFKGFKLALNDATEWGGQAQFSLGRWEENGTNARSSLVISLGHGGINSATNADVDVMTLLSSGNVGIGTTSPDNKLDIALTTAAISFDTAIKVSANTDPVDYTANRGAGILFQNAEPYVAGIYGIRPTLGGWRGHLLFYTHTSATGNTFGTTFTEKMRITDEGNVGIGTTAPDLTGFGWNTLTIVGGTTAGAAGVLELGSPTTDTNAQNLGIIAFMDGSTRNGQISMQRDTSTSTAEMLFYTNAGSGIAERMRIESGGNVSIGGIDPTYIFEVRTESDKHFSVDYAFTSVALKAHNNGASSYIPMSINAVDLILNNDSGGNVGIGTDSPAVRIDIKGVAGSPATSGTTQNGILRIQNSGNNNTLDIGQIAGSPYGTWLQATDKTDLSVEYPLILNPNGGNVGIGTTDPDTTLHVVGVSSFEETSGGAGTQMRLIGTDASGQYNFLLAKQYNVNNTFEITPSTAANGTTFSTPAFVVNSDGKVGIGDVSPAKLLSLWSSETTNTAQLDIQDSSSGAHAYLGTFSNNMYLTFGGTYTGGWASDGTRAIAGIVMSSAAADSNMVFQTTATNNAAPTTALTIDKSQNATFAGGVGVEKNVYQIESSGATRGLYSMRPWGGDYFTQTASVTGALAITLPATTNVDDMLKFTIEIYQYAEQESCLVHVGGYLTSSLNWGNVSATVIASGGHDQNYTVRFGNDGSNYVVWIGETTTVWAYPQVIIRDFFAGYGAVSGDVYLDEWGVDFVTSGQTISKTLTNNFPMSSGGTDDTYWTGSGNDIYNDNSGNVGIGTSSPGSIFDINSDSGVTELTLSNRDTSLVDTGEIQNRIKLRGLYYSGSGSLLVESQIASGHESSNGNGNSFLTFSTQSGGSAPEERMRIDSSGNVGIGVAPYSYSRLTSEGSDNTSSNYAFIAYKENTDSILACRNDGVVTMMSGNVGIGITAPVTKLHLSGYTAASASTSSNNGIFTLQSTNGVQLQMGSYASSPHGYWIQTKDANNAGPYNYPLILQPVNGNVGIGTDAPTVLVHALDSGTKISLLSGTVIGAQASTTTATNCFYSAIAGNAGISALVLGDTDDNDQARVQFNNSGRLLQMLNAGAGITIDSSGNVGIGTSDIDFELQVGGTDVSGTANFDAQFAVLSEATTGYPSGFIFKAPRVATSSNRVLLYEDFETYFSMQVHATSTAGAQSDTPIVLAPQGGNVAIGQTTAYTDGKLTVSESVNTDSAIVMNNQYNGSLASASLYLATYGQTWGVMVGSNTNESGALRFVLNPDGGSPVEKMRILTGGNVGIGTTSPAYKLDVNGALYTEKGSVMGSLTDTTENNPALTLNIKSGSENLRLADTDTTTSFGPYISFWDLSAGVRRGFISCSGGQSSGRYDMKVVAEYGEVQLWTGASNNEAKRVTVDTSGNVGIGVAEPVAKVDAKSTDAYDVTSHGVKAGRMQYSWYNGQYFSNNDAYVHMKTNLWMGGSPAGNTEYLMGGFTAKSFSYSADGYGEGSCMFHNWAGTFPNLNVTNRGDWATFMQSPYTSTDGYCVIVLRHNYYSSPIIDFQQSYNGYPWREVAVTAAITDANATGVY